MKTSVLWAIIVSFPLWAVTRHVSLTGGHVPPFTNGWASAATNIQAAVDVAVAGDVVLVQSGVYRLAATIVVARDIVVSSVHGAAWTVVTPKPFTYIRGFELGSNNCIVVGLTISNFNATWGSGVTCATTNPVIRHCIIAHNRGATHGAGVYYGTLQNCRLYGNAANDGMQGFGGALAYSEASACMISGNYARGQNSPYGGGGGCYYATVRGCVIVDNNALAGGGVHGGVASNCAIVGNRANFAAGVLNATVYDTVVANNVSALGHGGASGGRFERCRFVGNVTSNSDYAGGASGAQLLNCLLVDNVAISGVGGAMACALVNCTVARNTGNPGGISGGGLTNSIVYENSAPELNTSGLKAYYSCAPVPLSGSGNITNAPRFINSGAGDFHLRADSPCVEAGANAAAALPWDLDGQPRIQGMNVDMGCYENVPEAGGVGASLLFLIWRMRKVKE